MGDGSSTTYLAIGNIPSAACLIMEIELHLLTQSAWC